VSAIQEFFLQFVSLACSYSGKLDTDVVAWAAEESRRILTRQSGVMRYDETNGISVV
jgi:hypothetical protein